MKIKTRLPVLRCAKVTGVALIVLWSWFSTGTIIQWTNSNSGYWEVADNWSPNQMPSTNDTAVITNNGTYTVTLNINSTIAGLTLGGFTGTQTLATAERNLNLNGNAIVDTNGVLLLSGGRLSGNSQYDLHGTINWVYGAIDTNTTVAVAAGGHISIGSGAQFTKFLYGSVTNAGIITWRPLGSLMIGGTLCNTADGVFDMLLDNTSILATGTNAAIINDGLFQKTNGTGTIACYVPFINNGRVNTKTGSLALRSKPVFNSGCKFTGAGVTYTPADTNTLTGNIYSENLLFNGATLTGTSQLSGVVKWESGMIDSDAVITIATDGQLLIGSTFQNTKTLNGCLTNAGTIIWSPLGSLNLNGVLHNLTNALFDIQTGNSILSSGTNPVFINDGVLRRSVDTGGTASQVPLSNNGTVDVQSGTLILPGGSAMNDGSAFTGAGKTRMANGTNTLNGNVFSENLELAGCTLMSSGVLSGNFSWTAGTINAVLPFNITSNSSLTIGNGFNNTKTFNGDLTNAGTITWLPTGPLWLGGALHNLANGLFDIHGDVLLASNAPSAVIVNDGVFRKSAGGGTATCGPQLINNGLVKISSGRLTCAGGFLNPTGTLRMAGGIFQDSEPIYFPGGGIDGWGTVNASVTNSAMVNPNPTNGILTISGNYTQTLEGTTEFALGGTLPGTNQSRLNIIGKAKLNGSINIKLADGYLPPPGTSFLVMTFQSHDGEFLAENGFIVLGQGRRFTQEYASALLNLNVVTSAEPAEVPLNVIISEGSALIAWPLEFTGYELYYSTNLASANWTLIPGITNRYVELPPLPAYKFFQLRH